jgi:2-phospho-L-lactate guanylyltransferase
VRTAAVLPVKRYAAAKQRLADTVGDADRPNLAAAMVADVLEALQQVRGLDETIVVTSEPAVSGAGGEIIVADPLEAGHVEAALLGIRRALELGAERVLLVPGDCPALDPAEVTALLADGGRGAERSVTIVPDVHGSGTNALLLAPPDVMLPSFGPGSCARHEGLARASGAAVRIAAPASLTHDVDTPQDLARLAAYAERTGAAPRTRAALARAAFVA